MHAAPTAPSLGGSFPRSFLIPGTDTSIRVGGFVDFTALDFLNGGGAINGSNYGSNSGQNGQTNTLPVGGGFVPGLGFVNPQATLHAPSRNNGVLEFSPNQSRLDIETRTPTAWGEARTFFAFDWAGCSSGAITPAKPWRRAAATACSRAFASPMAHWAGSSPARLYRTSPTPMPTPNRWNSAAPSARPAVCASRRCATQSPARTAAPSRSRRKTRGPPVATPGGLESSDLNLSGVGTINTPPQQRLPPRRCAMAFFAPG